MPPELTGGIAGEGVRALREFVEELALVFLQSRADFAVEQFKLPLRNVLPVYPHRFLRAGFDTTHRAYTTNPMAKACEGTIAWSEDSPGV